MLATTNTIIHHSYWTDDYPKWKAITMRVMLMRSPINTSTTESAHIKPTVIEGYQRNT